MWHIDIKMVCCSISNHRSCIKLMLLILWWCSCCHYQHPSCRCWGWGQWREAERVSSPSNWPHLWWRGPGTGLYQALNPANPQWAHPHYICAWEGRIWLWWNSGRASECICLVIVYRIWDVLLFSCICVRVTSKGREALQYVLGAIIFTFRSLSREQDATNNIVWNGWMH